MLNSLSEFKFFQSFRVPVEEADGVRFLVEYENDEGEWQYIDDVKLVDISISGLAFKAKMQLSVGSELRISMQFKRLNLDLSGVVVRGFVDGPFEDKVLYGIELEEDRQMVKFVEQYLYSFNPERLRDCLIDLALTDRYSKNTEGVEMFSLLFSLFKDITHYGERKDFTENMLEEVCRLLNASRAAIFLINPETNELESKCSLGFSKEQLKFDYRAGIAGSVFTTGASLNIDVKTDKTRFNELIIEGSDTDIESVLCHPIHNHEDKIIGVIEAVNKRNNQRFTLEDEKIMKVLSVVFSSVFHSYDPISEQSQIRRFSTPFDREHVIIGKSSQVAEMRKAIVKLKDVNTPLIIQGKAGAGKSLFAEIIHREGKRGLAELVVFDVLDNEEMVEKELYFDTNYEKAKHGTFLVKHIDKLNSKQQKKFLEKMKQIYEHNQFDCRVIVTSRTDLSDLTSDGEFHHELYKYLNQGLIEIPTLEERKEDIEMLINYFIKIECRHQGLLIKSFSPKVMDEFLEYSWPGNIQELQDYIKRAVLLNPKNHVISNVNSLAIPKLVNSASGIKLFDELPYVLDSKLSLKDRVALIERKLIDLEIKKHKGNKSKASESLQISREALRKKVNYTDQLLSELESSNDQVKKAA